jgi:hypothetical protein
MKIERGKVVIETSEGPMEAYPSVEEIWELLMSKAWTYSQNNRKLIESGEPSDWCGCFYCLGLFRASHIKKWVGLTEDGRRIETETNLGMTAICPLCGVDAVIPEGSAFLFADEEDTSMTWIGIFLRKMEKRYFGRKHERK